MADSNLTLRIRADANQAISTIGRTSGSVSEFKQKVEAARIGMGRLTVAIAGAQAAVAALGAVVKGALSDMPRALLGGAVQAERMQTAFRVLTGSLQGARSEIAFVRREAYRLGIPLAEASDAWLKLAAAARGTALEGEAARRIFSAVAGATATLGLSASDTSGVLLAISQMMSNGTVQAEEMRVQLGDRLPGAIQIAARAMDKTTERFSEMMKRGEIIADDFLPRLASQLERELPAASDTTQQAINRVSNATEEWKRLVGEALATAIDGMLGLKDSASKLGQDDSIQEWARKSAKAIAIVIDVIRELALFVPNVLKTVGGSIAAVARDIMLVVDVASAAITEGVGAKGRAAMKRALEERNAFIAAYNEDMVKRWFPKQLATRVDEFFAALRSQTAAAAGKTGAALKRLAGAAQAKPARTGDMDAARLSAAKAMADAELAIVKDGLARQAAALEAALQDRLVSIKGYYAEKARIEQAEIDAEIRRVQAALAEQQRVARTGSEAERIRARGEVARLEADLIVLNNRRADIEIENARAAAQAERELADALAAAREELAQITGTATDADRRAAIERSWRDLRARLAAENDAAGVSLIDRLIDVKAAQASLSALEAAWGQAQERMRIAQDAARISFEAGLITQSEYQARVAQTSAEAAAALEELIPKMQAAASAIGPDAELRVAALANRLAELKTVVDPVAKALETDFKNAFVNMFEAIGSRAKSAKDAVLDFARSVAASLQRIAAQKFAEQIFGSIGKGGGALAGIFRWLGFASGGYVTGPGTATSDSIPARLSAGEYVVRAEAVRRVGVAFLDAINGLRSPPAWDGRRLAFAAGGIVPVVQTQPTAAPSVRIINTIDPSIVDDWAESSSGERAILNVIGRNPTRVRHMLGG